MRVKYECFAKTRENEKELQKFFGGKNRENDARRSQNICKKLLAPK